MADVTKIIKQMSKWRRSELDKALYLNAWIYGSLALSIKNRTNDTTDVSLEQLNGACGHRDNLFREVAEAAGWKSRRVGFHDVPIQIAHVGTEVFVDGKWRFFDPTFGMYITSADDHQDILSIQEARYKYPHVKVHRTNQAPFAGKWLKKVDMASTVFDDQILMHPLGDWALAKIDGTYFLSSLTLEIEDWKHVSEFILPVHEGCEFTYTEEQLGSGHIEMPYGKSYVAYAQIIGKYWGRGPNITKRFSLLTDTDLDVTLRLQLRHVPLENVYASMRQALSDYTLDAMNIEKSIDGKEVSWTFKATVPMTKFNIDVSEGYSAVIENMSISAKSPLTPNAPQT